MSKNTPTISVGASLNLYYHHSVAKAAKVSSACQFLHETQFLGYSVISNHTLEDSVMYLWNYRALALDFKHHRVTSKEKFKYLLLLMIYVPTGIMGSNWIPGIYRLIYKLTNIYLLIKAPSRVPPLKIFNDFNYVLDIAIPIIIGVGITACFIANRRGDGRFFIDRFMCMVIPVSIRVSMYVLFIFLASLCASLFFFNYKLQLISSMPGGFFRVFKKLKHLKQLGVVMAYISHRMHIFSCILSIVSLLWMFLILFKQIGFIAQPPKETQ